MRRLAGILGLTVVVFVATGLLEPNFLSAYNLQNLTRWTALFGILSLSATFVIVTGGIDLSIGSVVCLVGSVLGWLLSQRGWSAGAAVAAVMTMSVGIGLAHGLLVTRLSLPPFVVTLCGLLIYRGLARWLTGDQTVGLGASSEGLRSVLGSRVPLPLLPGAAIPAPAFIALAFGVASAAFFHRTTWGRGMLALGRNEEAARFSGVRTGALTVFGYVACAAGGGLGGVLFAVDVNSIQAASHGSFYELYAIAGAVLGGCSLRGGEVSAAGALLGAAVMRVLYNAINLLRIPTQLELAIIGAVLLLGVVADELTRRAARK